MLVNLIGASQDNQVGIVELRRLNAEATRWQDHGALLRLMSDDPVVLAPGATPLQGREPVEAAIAHPPPNLGCDFA